MRPRLIVLASIAGLAAWVFGDALFSGGMFAFRDAAHFYYPLFKFIQGEWAAGRVPLWDPYENLGMPLAANPAASVFYPGKLVFALPLGFAWAYRLYVIGHVLLAAGGAYLLARRWRAGTLAAGACALSYAFSGNVLVDHANVVFLVGAAWLPFAVLAADRMLARRSVQAAVGFGVVLALMVTGGDPEMAYHAGLLAALYALILWRHGRPAHRNRVGCVQRTRGPLSEPAERDRTNWLVRCTHPTALFRHRLVLLGTAALVGLVLAAVQVVPSMELAARSDRAGSDVARSVYEIPGHLGEEDAARRIADGLLYLHPRPGTHREHVYHFSVGPWRLAEYLWPNFSGRQYPENRRWLDVIPAEARVWAPSLYMGLLPLVLAVGAMRFRRGRPRDRWLSWSAVLAVVASFGWFGLGWLVHEVQVACGGDPASWLVGGPVGGLYWLLTVLLPGYVQFRYPAKLLVVAALALSVLAARGWDRAFSGHAPRLRVGLLVLGGLSLGLAVAALAIRPWWAGWLGGVEPDSVFGPLDAAGAYRDLLGGLLQTALLCGVFWWLLGRPARRGRWVPAGALVLVALDLAVANGWIVVCAPAGLWREPSRLAAEIAKHEAQRGSGPPLRVYRRPWWEPAAWASRGSPGRLGQAVRWDRDTLFPKYNLAARLAVGEVPGTMALRDHADYVAFSQYVILRGDERPPPQEPMVLVTRSGPQAEDYSLWWNQAARPRVWVEGQQGLSHSNTPDTSLIDSQKSNVLLAESEPGRVGPGKPGRHAPARNNEHDITSLRINSRRATPAVSLVPKLQLGNPGLRSAASPDRKRSFREVRCQAGAWEREEGGERGQGGRHTACACYRVCRVVHYDPVRVEIEAEMAEPGLVVLADQFYPGWQLEVQTAGKGARRVPIVRTVGGLRGAWLEAGRHRLIYRYRPAGFYWGAAISAIGWLVLGGGAVLRCWRARKARVPDETRRAVRPAS